MIGYCILQHSVWFDGIFVPKYARLNEKLIKEWKKSISVDFTIENLNLKAK